MRRSARFAIGAAAGFAFGLVLRAATLLEWSVTPRALARTMLATLLDADPRTALALLAVTLAGALLGGATARLLRFVFGATAGGLAGLGVFVLGYLAASWPVQPSRRMLAAMAREALLSLSVAELACVALGLGAGIALTRFSWRTYGVASYVAVISVVAGYIVHTASVSLPRVDPRELPFSILLFIAETLSLSLAAVHAFYALDIASRRRLARNGEDEPFSAYHQPRVAFHVAAYDEPPELVEETLRSLLALDYPRERYHVMLLDDSTDEATARRLSRFCEAHEVTYLHRADRRGFKAGALNDALRVTPANVDLVAVIDADYQVEPSYLRDTVGYFIDPKLGFLQTPQDYRNVEESFITRRYHLADAFFYRAVMPSRNEENAIIFCGTMGIIRRSVLEEAGGWGEEYLCEDSELSVRVLSLGYHSLYINRTYGRGLIPTTYDDFRRQHHRWAYGGGQILRGHGGDILRSRMSFRQKADFLLGGLHWYDGAIMLMMAILLLGLAAAELSGARVVTHHAGEVVLLSLVPFFLLFDGIVRLHVALRRTMAPPLRGTLGVLGLWMSVKTSNAWGATKGFFGVPMAFARTQKGGRRANGRVPSTELFVALALAVASVMLAAQERQSWQLTDSLSMPRALLSTWLMFYALAFGAAPWYALRSRISAWRAPAAVDEAAPQP